MVSAANGDYADLLISRDRTLKERQYLQEVRKELEAHKKEGGSSLTIKYAHGILTTVKGLSKTNKF